MHNAKFFGLIFENLFSVFGGWFWSLVWVSDIKTWNLKLETWKLPVTHCVDRSGKCGIC